MSKELNEKLDSKIPMEAVSKRKTNFGGALSYLETWYVIDRMNKVFGNTGWDRETIEMKQLPVENPSYMAKVRVTIKGNAYGGITLQSNSVYLPNPHCIKEGYGYGSCKSKTNPDHELAIKEAESDAFKRAAMQLGLSMGLALYDKTQEHVETETKEDSVQTLKQTVAKATQTFKCDLKEIKEKFGIIKSTNDMSQDEARKLTSLIEETLTKENNKHGTK